MPKGDPRDRFLYPTLTLMKDSYNLRDTTLADRVIADKPRRLP